MLRNCPHRQLGDMNNLVFILLAVSSLNAGFSLLALSRFALCQLRLHGPQIAGAERGRVHPGRQ